MGGKQEHLDHIDGLDRAKYKPFTPEQRAKKQATFLRALGKHGVVKVACKAAGISRQTFKNWRDHDPEFAAQLPDANEDKNDTLEYAAYSQAVEGVPSYVVSQGKMVFKEEPVLDKDGKPTVDSDGRVIFKRTEPLIERKYAPSLLIALLKANMPEKYKDRVSQEHSGSIDLTGARDTLLEKMRSEVKGQTGDEQGTGNTISPD